MVYYINDIPKLSFMRIAKYKNKYEAFTIIELLLVMSIFVVLFAISLASYRGIQSTTQRNQTTLTLVNDVHTAQRLAVLLTKEKDQKWPYGIGLDFSQVPENGHIENVEYYIFRWCSPVLDPDTQLTKGRYPNFHKDTSESGIPVGSNKYNSNACNASSSLCDGKDSCYLEKILGIDNIVRSFNKSVQVNRGKVAYVLFESVTGRVFFYDNSGKLLNYDADGNFNSTDPVSFELWITSVDGLSKKITISPISGRIELTNEKHEYQRL